MTRVLYPLFFAVSFVLAIAAGNVGQYRSSDLGTVLTVVILLTGLALATAFAGVWAFDRTDRAAPRAAGLAMLLVLWIFYYIPAQNALARLSHRFASSRVLVPLGIMITLAAALWLLRQSAARLRSVSSGMTLFGLLLLAMVSVQALIAQHRGARAARRSALVRELAEPLRSVGAPAPNRNTPPRDIYLIVLDGHANARVLKEVFGFDNSRFEDRLRALGFLIPRDMRSNYVQTYLSVSSLLNFAHITRLAEDAGPTSKDHSLPTYLVKHNRAAGFLKGRGYKYVLFPSAWWAATANSPLADEEFDPRQKSDLQHEVFRSELRLTMIRSTLLGFTIRSHKAHLPVVQHVMRSFEGLHRVPDDPAPTFTFAHVLLPHVPYLVDERCHPLEHMIPDNMEADTPEQREDYIGQVRCVDRLVLDLVNTLLQRSSTSPVILIVGDHGPRFADVGFYGHPEKVSRAFLRERFGAFGAFYLPADGNSAFTEPVTLVNVLGNVLRYYFNVDVPANANEMYVSGEQLYRFYPIDPSLLGPLPIPAQPSSPSTIRGF